MCYGRLCFVDYFVSFPLPYPSYNGDYVAAPALGMGCGTWVCVRVEEKAGVVLHPTTKDKREDRTYV